MYYTTIPVGMPLHQRACAHHHSARTHHHKAGTHQHRALHTQALCTHTHTHTHTHINRAHLTHTSAPLLEEVQGGTMDPAWRTTAPLNL